MVAAVDTVVTGTVKQVLPGLLEYVPGTPVSAVFVEVDEIKKEAPNHEQLTRIIFYFQFAASARYGDKQLCTENAGFLEARVGDRVLVLGNTYLNIPGFFRQRQVFKVLEDGTVQREPFLYLSSEPLQNLRALQF